MDDDDYVPKKSKARRSLPNPGHANASSASAVPLHPRRQSHRHRSAQSSPPPVRLDPTPDPTPVPTSPAHSDVLSYPQLAREPDDKEQADKIVEIAVEEALRHFRYPTAWALRLLYDENAGDPHFVSMIEDVYYQRATPKTIRKFRHLISEKKKEGKKENKGCYYFVPPSTGTRFTPHKPEPAPYENLIKMEFASLLRDSASDVEVDVDGHVSKRRKIQAAQGQAAPAGQADAHIELTLTPAKAGAGPHGQRNVIIATAFVPTAALLRTVPDDAIEDYDGFMGSADGDPGASRMEGEHAEGNNAQIPAGSMQPISVEQAKPAIKKQIVSPNPASEQNTPTVHHPRSRDSSMPAAVVPTLNNLNNHHHQRHASLHHHPVHPTLKFQSQTAVNTKSVSVNSFIREPLGLEELPDEPDLAAAAARPPPCRRRDAQFSRPLAAPTENHKPSDGAQPSIKMEDSKQSLGLKLTDKKIDGILTPGSGDMTLHLEFDLQEDIEDQIEELVRLSRLGHFAVAKQIFHDSFKQHLQNPYLLVQYADLLLQQGDFKGVVLLEGGPIFDLAKQNPESRELQLLCINWDLMQLTAKTRTLDAIHGVSALFDKVTRVLRGLEDREASLGSTEIKTLGLTLQLTSSPTLKAKWLRRDRGALNDLPTVSKHVYRTLLHQGRIWDFHDLLTHMPSMGKVHSILHGIFSTDLLASLNTLILDWSTPSHEYDTATTLALLSILTHIVLEPIHTPLEHRVEIVKLSRRLASSMLQHDPTSELETPSWAATEALPEAMESARLALRAAKSLGDIRTQVLSLKELIRLSTNPQKEFDALCGLQLAGGDWLGYGQTLPSRYLIATTHPEKEILKTKITEVLSHLTHSSVCDPGWRWAITMLMYKLEGRSLQAMNYLLNKDFEDYHNIKLTYTIEHRLEEFVPQAQASYGDTNKGQKEEYVAIQPSHGGTSKEQKEDVRSQSSQDTIRPQVGSIGNSESSKQPSGSMGNSNFSPNSSPQQSKSQAADVPGASEEVLATDPYKERLKNRFTRNTSKRETDAETDAETDIRSSSSSDSSVSVDVEYYGRQIAKLEDEKSQLEREKAGFEAASRQWLEAQQAANHRRVQTEKLS
ncbi:hypothetical protein NUW58_g9190 [Xylaria curta]|uniref:Uncharacterized protein n=1 Tax=Xylaria curta TaxID=42375 RepID=A0ACC1N1Q1_9PEZI|nr:hypothetical protein NUW58_g9190 [Xylaria curta]